MSGVNNAPNYYETMRFGHKNPADGSPVIDHTLLQGGIVSAYYLGTLCGALLGGALGDRFGRIRTIALACVWAILGASLQASAQNHNWMICGNDPFLATDQGQFPAEKRTVARFARVDCCEDKVT